MADSKYFGIPFATSGDKATIPEATQPSGAISFTQGFGPDYERDPETDPLAKRVPRDETNELYFQVTNALKFLQLYGTPEWYATDDAGNPVSYPLSARVRHDAGAGMQAWRSLVASNTATPGSDATKWALDTPFDIAALEATLAEAIAGTSASKIMTPRRNASAAQRNPWRKAAIGGTANALTMTLSPAPASLADLTNSPLTGVITTTNTGAVTLNVNGLGVTPVKNDTGADLAAGDLPVGSVVAFTFDGTNFQVAPLLAMVLSKLNKGSTIVVFSTTGSTSWTPPAGVRSVFARVWGAGGGGGGNQSSGAGGGGGGGGYAEGYVSVTPGTPVTVTVGAGGAGGPGNTTWGPGGTGGSSSFGASLSATGGGGGQGAAPNSQGVSGGGGSGTGGHFRASGGSGSSGSYLGTYSIGGVGGSGASGGGSGGGSSTGLPTNGQVPGGGAGGAGSNFGGGNGAAGLVIIEYFAP